MFLETFIIFITDKRIQEGNFQQKHNGQTNKANVMFSKHAYQKVGYRSRYNERHTNYIIWIGLHTSDPPPTHPYPVYKVHTITNLSQPLTLTKVTNWSISPYLCHCLLICFLFQTVQEAYYYYHAQKLL